MLTKKIIKAIVLLFPIVLFLGQCHITKKKTNVILIVADILRADHLGCYGYYRNTSPHIDSFSGESLLFKNAFKRLPGPARLSRPSSHPCIPSSWVMKATSGIWTTPF
jgi:hypothetical protein